MSPPSLLVCQVSHTGLQGEVYEEDEEDDEEHNDEDYNQYYPAIEFVVKAHIILTDPFTLNNNSNQWRVEWRVESSYLAVCLCLTGAGGETPPTARGAGRLAGRAGLEEPRVGGAVEVGAVAHVVKVHPYPRPGQTLGGSGGNVYITTKLSAPPSPCPLPDTRNSTTLHCKPPTDNCRTIKQADLITESVTGRSRTRTLSFK